MMKEFSRLHSCGSKSSVLAVYKVLSMNKLSSCTLVEWLVLIACSATTLRIYSSLYFFWEVLGDSKVKAIFVLPQVAASLEK